MAYASVIILAFLLAHSDGQLRYFSNIEEFERSLQPVQGLYVKPSGDGETGDLFVAASEDSGAQTPWVADTSVQLMPPREPNRPTDRGDVAASPPSDRRPMEEEPRYVQVPQLFYNQLIAAAAAGTAERVAAEKSDPSRAASFVQAWGSYAYPQPQFVLVAPEEWVQARTRSPAADAAAPAAPAAPAASAAASAPAAASTADEPAGQGAGQIRLIKL